MELSPFRNHSGISADTGGLVSADGSCDRNDVRIRKESRDRGDSVEPTDPIGPVVQGRVSVVLPTYNRAQFIEECIGSVLDQSYRDIELVVVDDGSTDRTDDILRSLHDSRLICVWQQNRGRSAARNLALRLASGEFIAFIDSDDCYLPDKITRQVEHLRRRPDTAMVYTSASCVGEHDEPLPSHYEATVSGNIYYDAGFFLPVTITLPSVMVRRSVLSTVGGFDETMERFEDTDLWRRIAKLHRIDGMPFHSCRLRTHKDNHLRAQNADSLARSLCCYAEKVLAQDHDMDRGRIMECIARLFAHYGEAMLGEPHLAATGAGLLRTSVQFQLTGLQLRYGRWGRLVYAAQRMKARAKSAARRVARLVRPLATNRGSNRFEDSA
jgi:hypothetical protein